MVTDFELMELLSAKFCHDLSGPIGAVNNGVEFLREKDNPDMEEKAIQLIEISAQEAVVRLQFFRYAYGTLPSVGEANLEQLKILCTNFFMEGKVQIDWKNGGNNSLPVSIGHKTGRLLLNVILICGGMLIYGGIVSVCFQKLPNGVQIKVSGKGNNIKVDPDVINLLRNKGNDEVANSRNVHPFFTARLAKDLGASISVEQANTDNIDFIIEKTKS